MGPWLLVPGRAAPGQRKSQEARARVSSAKDTLRRDRARARLANSRLFLQLRVGFQSFPETTGLCKGCLRTGFSGEPLGARIHASFVASFRTAAFAVWRLRRLGRTRP